MFWHKSLTCIRCPLSFITYCPQSLFIAWKYWHLPRKNFQNLQRHNYTKLHLWRGLHGLQLPTVDSSGQHYHMPWSRISILEGTAYSSHPWHFSTYGVIWHKLTKFKIKFVSKKHTAYLVYGKLFYMLMLSGPLHTPHQLSNTWGYLSPA